VKASSVQFIVRSDGQISGCPSLRMCGLGTVRFVNRRAITVNQ